eukprot:866044-Pelagomonas_calceolata.AAC.5
MPYSSISRSSRRRGGSRGAEDLALGSSASSSQVGPASLAHGPCECAPYFHLHGSCKCDPCQYDECFEGQVGPAVLAHGPAACVAPVALRTLCIVLLVIRVGMGSSASSSQVGHVLLAHGPDEHPYPL